MSENNYEVDTKQENENLKMGFEQIKTMYAMQLDRLKSADEKLNMVLVFNAAVLALLTIVLPFSFESNTKLISSIVVVSFFIASMTLTVISIFIGLFPKKVYHIDSIDYLNPSTYHCTSEQFIGKFMSGFKYSIDSVVKTVEKKQQMNKHAMIFTMINMAFIVALLLIKII
ncbi:MAG: hypothetical protein WCR27_08170 [Eubacteriales bacterium]